MMDLAGQVALITGAGGGIGRGTAQALGARGVRIIAADIDEAGAGQTVLEILAAGGQAEAVHCDVGVDGPLEQARDLALSRFGRLDIVMNNVGVLINGRPQDIPLSEWQRIFNLNFMSAVRAVNAVVPHFLAQGSGHIVNTASFAGLYPYAYDRTPYAASKAALISYSENLAIYLKPQGVGVTCLCPGPVATGIRKSNVSWTDDLPTHGPGDQFGRRDPRDVGEMVCDAIEQGRFFLPTDDQVTPILVEHARDMDAYLAAELRRWE